MADAKSLVHAGPTLLNLIASMTTRSAHPRKAFVPAFFSTTLPVIALGFAGTLSVFAADSDGPSTPRPRRDGLSRTNLMEFRAADETIRPVTKVDDWEKRRASILAAMQSIMGPLPGPEKRCALDVKIEDEVDCGSYVRRSISYAAEPAGRVPAFLLVPKRVLTGGARAPGVLALHQTRPEGKGVVVGLAKRPDDEYGVHLAERGFVVLAPPYTMLADYSPTLTALGYQSGTMKSIWDNIRGLDVLETLPYVKTNGFGTIGHSLGGHNGVFTAVFDRRIKVIVTSCGLDSFVDYYDGDPKVWQPERGWCQRRYMPKLLGYAGRLEEIPFDFHELIGVLAPRACFINAPTGDSNFKWKSVDAVTNAAVKVYQLYGRAENLQVAHPDCEHRFPPEMRERAYRLLEAELK